MRTLRPALRERHEALLRLRQVGGQGPAGRREGRAVLRAGGARGRLCSLAEGVDASLGWGRRQGACTSPWGSQPDGMPCSLVAHTWAYEVALPRGRIPSMHWSLPPPGRFRAALHLPPSPSPYTFNACALPGRLPARPPAGASAGLGGRCHAAGPCAPRAPALRVQRRAHPLHGDTGGGHCHHDKRWAGWAAGVTWGFGMVPLGAPAEPAGSAGRPFCVRAGPAPCPEPSVSLAVLRTHAVLRECALAAAPYPLPCCSCCRCRPSTTWHMHSLAVQRSAIRHQLPCCRRRRRVL